MAKKIRKGANVEGTIEKMEISSEQREKLFIDQAQGQVNPSAIGSIFLRYCIDKGWILQEGSGVDAKYFISSVGKIRLKEYGIE